MSYPESPQPPHAPPPRKSSLKWLWILLAIFVILIVGCVGLCVAMGYWGLEAAKGAAPLYGEALERVKQSPEVQEQLGTPIEDQMPTQFQFDDSADGTGTAEYEFAITGPEGTADVRVEGTRADGTWEFTVLDVTLEDGTVIDLK